MGVCGKPSALIKNMGDEKKKNILMHNGSKHKRFKRTLIYYDTDTQSANVDA